MEHSKEDVGKPCPVCGRTITLWEGHDYSYLACSSFCSEAGKDDIETFKAAKSGDWCLYPCPGCGEMMEDQWFPEEPSKCVCSDCAVKARRKNLANLLKESLDALEPPELIEVLGIVREMCVIPEPGTAIVLPPIEKLRGALSRLDTAQRAGASLPDRIREALKAEGEV